MWGDWFVLRVGRDKRPQGTNGLFSMDVAHLKGSWVV